MNESSLPLSRMERLTGFGMLDHGDGYAYRPASAEDVRWVLFEAKQAQRKVVLRGAGRSYGDANIGAECVYLDMTRFSRVLNWDPSNGTIECEAGATIEDVWRHTLEDGFWPPVVSGTMFPTLGGALGMNIHGKNNFKAGTLGEHVSELDVMDAEGAIRTLTPRDDEFYAVISGAGLLGVILRVNLRLKRVTSGDLRVYARPLPNLEAQFEAFEEFEKGADYMVSWVDLFGERRALGRGLFHAAWYAQDDPGSLRVSRQDLPDTIMGLVPKSMAWRALQPLNNRFGMRYLNMAKHYASAILGDKMHHQSLVAFSFLLDYVPNWRNAYLPGGFIQYQCFIPKKHAFDVFRKQIEMQQAAGLESFLGVMKRHRPDRFLLSHAVDGYSLAMDFKVTQGNRKALWRLAHRMNDVVLQAGGRFYLAKDSTLRPSDVVEYVGRDALTEFGRMRRAFDPSGLFTNGLAKRLGLDDPLSLLSLDAI